MSGVPLLAFIAGFFLDWISIVLLLVPIFAPLSGRLSPADTAATQGFMQKAGWPPPSRA
jgi:TRAP-type C4-dicarboxylate transport system permease large subunit